MAMSFVRTRALLVLPAVLLVVSLLEQIATYKAREHVRDPYLRAAVVVLLDGAAFAIAAELVGPWLQRAITTTRRGSLRHAGTVGLLLFYVVAYGALYYAYVLKETGGIAALLPRALR
jgi:hypothetical protein